MNPLAKRVGAVARLARGPGDTFKATLVTAVERDELARALRCAVARLMAESGEVRSLAEKIEPDLRELVPA